MFILSLFCVWNMAFADSTTIVDFNAYTASTTLHAQDGWVSATSTTVIASPYCVSGKCASAYEGSLSHAITPTKKGSVTFSLSLPATTNHILLGVELVGTTTMSGIQLFSLYTASSNNNLQLTPYPWYYMSFGNDPYHIYNFTDHTTHTFTFEWDFTDDHLGEPHYCAATVSVDGGAPASVFSSQDVKYACIARQNIPDGIIAGIKLAPVADADDPFMIDDVTSVTASSTTSTTCTSDCYSNVMFLPGIEASSLYENTGSEQARWLPYGDDDANRLALSVDGAGGNAIYTKQGDIIRNGYGLSDVYASFTLYMDSYASEKNINWEGIAYDWRLDYDTLLNTGIKNGINISYLSTTSTPYIIQELQHLAFTSPTGKVSIIAHSNGGLLAKALLSHPEHAQYVDKLIMVASPQLGTPAAMGHLLHGLDAGIPFSDSPTFLSAAEARKISKTFPVAYNLLPSQDYFTFTDNPLITFNNNLTLLGTTTGYNWRTIYTDPATTSAGIHSAELLRTFLTASTARPAPSYSDLLTPELLSQVQFDTASSTHAALDHWLPPAGLNVYTVVGWGEETLSGIDYRTILDKVCNTTSSTPSNCMGRPRLGYKPLTVIDGDGTVVASSAGTTSEAGKRFWMNLESYNKILGLIPTPQFMHAKHANVLSTPQINTLVANILVSTSSNIALPQYVTTYQPNSSQFERRLHYVLHSPLTLGFKDSLGNYTGAATSSFATSSVSQIPAVTYERFGEVQFLSVPKSLSGQVIMQGIASGSFTLDVDEVQGNTVLASTVFEGVPNSTSTKVTLSVSSTTPVTASSTLLVDFDGNGTTDASLPAAQGASTAISPHPEAQLQIKNTDLTAVKVVGSGTASTTATTYSNYAVLKDALGNSEGIAFEKTSNANGSLASLSLTGISYNGSATTSPQASGTITYTYSTTTASTTLYQQHLTIGTTASAATTYNPTTNTTFVESDDHGVHYQYTWTSLKILRLITQRGVVKWMFGS